MLKFQPHTTGRKKEKAQLLEQVGPITGLKKEKEQVGPITGRKKEKAQLLEEVGPITCRKKMGCGFNVSVTCIPKT